VVALLVVVAAAAWMAPISASAGGVSQARSELQRARAQLRALDVRLSILAQRIHEGKVLLRTLRSDLAAATGRTARARAAAKEASAELEATARRAYEGVGTTAGLAALIGSNSVSDVLQGIDYMSALADHTAQVAEDARVARNRAQRAEAQTRSLELAQENASAQLKADRSRMQSAVVAQRRLIGQLSERLKHQIALAVAARLAAARAAAAVPAPDPGGPPPPPENQIDSLIYSIWGRNGDGRVAECIADHESGDNPNSRNASGAAGLFQLMPFWWDGNNRFGWQFDPYDAKANAQHAYLIWQRDGWNPWTTRPFCA
jgi:peptidoglycan hydrolase CwlO-like protein